MTLRYTPDAKASARARHTVRRGGPVLEVVEGARRAFSLPVYYLDAVTRPPSKIERSRVRDRRGRVWTVSVVPLKDADDEDFHFWSSMSPDARVALMSECLLDGLKTRGKRELPRFRRVYRVTQRPAR